MQLLIFKGGVQIVTDKIKSLQAEACSSEGDNSACISLLIEVVSTAKRIYGYLEEQKSGGGKLIGKGESIIDTNSNDNDQLMIEELAETLQLLLKCDNKVLLI